jgi:hypothetical protein
MNKLSVTTLQQFITFGIGLMFLLIGSLSQAAATSPIRPISSPYPSPDPGCHYETVQCITAPCDPIQVCPIITPSPSPSPTATASSSAIPTPTATPSPIASSSAEKSDLNNDNKVNILDYTLFIQSLLTTNENADIDNSGLVDLLDFTIFIQHFQDNI